MKCFSRRGGKVTLREHRQETQSSTVKRIKFPLCDLLVSGAEEVMTEEQKGSRPGEAGNSPSGGACARGVDDEDYTYAWLNGANDALVWSSDDL